MATTDLVRRRFMGARRRGSAWVGALDAARLLVTRQGRGVLWTSLVHGDQVHQTTAYTRDERYPALFDLAARLSPDARRILSFGCSTGEELVALRRRFHAAQIVGAEINPRSRRIAARRVRSDERTLVVRPHLVEGPFDIVFALAVLQREPHKITAMGIEDLSTYYPFDRFDSAVRGLAAVTAPGGLLCVINTQYRVEDSSVFEQLEPVHGSPALAGPLFRPDGRRLRRASASSIFRKQPVRRRGVPRGD